MKWGDRFDMTLAGALLVVVMALGVFVLDGSESRGDGAESRLQQELERQLAHQARVAFLRDLYQPVLEMREQGKNTQALLKLEEIGRSYPGEAYGLLLKGGILGEMEIWEGAIKSYAEAVRQNGDFVDEHSPLSHRTEIQQVVEKGREVFRARLETESDNPPLLAALRNVHYLQSRLAGGCE